MPNRNYLRGVAIERKLVNQHRDKGEIAFRTAGSHSPVDVCSVDIQNRVITLYQCKRVKKGGTAPKVDIGIPEGQYTVKVILHVHKDGKNA